MEKLLQIHPADNVAVALADVAAGEVCALGTPREAIARGHKMALGDIKAGEPVIKYGYPIGAARQDIPAGAWVHTHNVKTRLSDADEYQYAPKVPNLAAQIPASFMGYRRPDGRAATRNELWVIPTVGCVNGIAEALCRQNQHLVKGSVEGLYAFSHPWGCSQTGDDHLQTQRLLASLCHHPNAGGVLVLGLGCENNTMDSFRAVLGDTEQDKFAFLVCQEAEDEFAQGSALLEKLAGYAGQLSREEIPASELVLGMKCGGSDGLSGITANPVVGRITDTLCAQGGSVILTEVPEMFGAENVLLERCINTEVYDKATEMLRGFKAYFTTHGQPVYENPSPGNKQGGITTLEDKSLGCVQKGGSAPVVDVVPYGGRVKAKGLNLLEGPGNDLVSATALTAAGAHMVLFTTGRGTPFGAPAPTMKIATNTALFTKKPGWMDFNAGTAAEGEPLDAVAGRLYEKVLAVASGEQTRAEKNGMREISIFKDGVVL